MPFLILLLAVPSGLFAADDLDQLEQKAFRAAVDRVAPSVVRIETLGGLEQVGEVRFGTGPTTGLVLSPDGYIVSSAFNFAQRPASILVQLPDGARKPAKLVATDHNRMIALLKIEPDKPLPVPEIAPEKEARVGQWAIGVGRAFEGSQPNMSVGVVSATNRIWGKAIQTDAAVSPNNYGGPLVDIRGRVLGVLVPLSPEETTEMAGYEWYDSGIGFAVPAEFIQQLLPKLKEGKDLRPGMTGLSMPAKTMLVGEPVISTVRPRSPAQKAGLKGGDRVVEIDGRKIDRAADVKQEIARRYAGDKLHLTVLRDSKRVEADVELVAKLDPYQQPFLGVLPLRPVTDQAKTKPSGIPIRYVYPDSPAAKAGIERGDVLVSLGGNPIEDLRALRARFRESQPGDVVQLEVRRGKDIRKLEIKLATVPETIPAEGIPPAHPAAKPAEGKEPERGSIQLKGPANRDPVAAYVPEAYSPDVGYGIVVWLHGPEGMKEAELIAAWKPFCDQHDLILVAPKSTTTTRWRPAEVRMVPMLLAQLAAAYTIDSSRVVVCGRETGGTLAYSAAFSYANLVRGIAAVDAPMSGPMTERDSPLGLAVYVARAEKSRFGVAIKQTVSRLREMKFPVTIKELGPAPRDLHPDELGELARWIDTLDRM